MRRGAPARLAVENALEVALPIRRDGRRIMLMLHQDLFHVGEGGKGGQIRLRWVVLPFTLRCPGAG